LSDQIPAHMRDQLDAAATAMVRARIRLERARWWSWATCAFNLGVCVGVIALNIASTLNR